MCVFRFFFFYVQGEINLASVARSGSSNLSEGATLSTSIFPLAFMGTFDFHSYQSFLPVSMKKDMLSFSCPRDVV